MKYEIREIDSNRLLAIFSKETEAYEYMFKHFNKCKVIKVSNKEMFINDVLQDLKRA